MKMLSVRMAIFALAVSGAFLARGELTLKGDFNRQVVSSGLTAQIPDLQVVDEGGNPLDSSAYSVAYAGNDAYGQATVTVTVTAGTDAGTVLEKTFDVVPVPTAYQPLKWVELDSRQSIRTSIIPNNNMDIDIRLSHLDQLGGKDGGQAICCQKWTWGSGYLFAFNGKSKSVTRNHFYVNNGSGGSSYSILGDFAAEREYHIKLDHATSKATLDDSAGNHIEVGYTPGANATSTLNLFCDQDGDSRLSCRLYHFTFFENGAPFLDLVPVRRIADDKVGLFDAAHPTAETSFYASNLIDFLPGPIGDAVTVEPIPDQAFTGSAVTPPVTVIRQNGESKTPLSADDFDIAYANNVALGTAIVTITGKGAYSGVSGGAMFQIVLPSDETRIVLGGTFGLHAINAGVEAKILDLEVLDAKGQPLARGTYQVGYLNNTANGTATVWARVTSGKLAGAITCRTFEVRVVPLGYTPIQWIESTGTQWINTGVQAGPGLVTACTISPNEEMLSGQHAVFGCWQWGSTGYCALTSDGKWRPASGGKYTDGPSIVPGAINTLTYTIAGLQVDDSYTDISKMSGYNAGANSYNIVYIFEAPSRTTSDAAHRGYFKLYSLSMSDGLGVLREFVPVLDPDQKPGLYDVSHIQDGDLAFYPNANSTGDDFVAGPPCIEVNFAVPEIPDQNLLSGPPTPITRIVDRDTGMSLNLNDFDIVYTDNDKPGRAAFSVTGKTGTPYEDQWISGSFFIRDILIVSGYSLETEGTGSSWESPMSFTNAMTVAATLGESEIWIKSGTLVIPETKSYTIAQSLVIRGGFAGTERSAAERPLGSRTTFDGNGANDCLTVVNSAHLTIDRLCFVRGWTRGLTKSGAGDFVASDCAFLNCGVRNVVVSGHAMNLSGANATATLTSCLIAGCVDTASVRGPNHHGAVAIQSGMKRVIMDDCQFLTNGVPFGSWNLWNEDGRGAAIWAESPVALRRCEFRGNSGMDGGFGCAVVYLFRGSGGSVLKNCLFVGNNGIKEYGDFGGYANIARGCLVVRQNEGELTEVENCTFAYNLVMGLVNDTTGMTGAAGINVVSGDTVVKNCIFYGNGVHTSFPETQTIDMTCHNPSPTATLSVSYTLAHDLYPGEGNMTGDPRFVSTTNEFFKLLETENPSLPRLDMAMTKASHFRPEKLAEVMALDVHVRRGSPAIDTGDPQSDFSREREPNGRRINLGAYGNTAEAACSPGGTMLLIR